MSSLKHTKANEPMIKSLFHRSRRHRHHSHRVQDINFNRRSCRVQNGKHNERDKKYEK